MTTFNAFDFIGDYRVNVDPIIDSQSTTNMYISLDTGKSYTDNPSTDKSFISIPGSIKSFTFEDQPADSEVRACKNINDTNYWVCGNGVYIVTNILTSLRIGTLLTTTGYVAISNNLTQVIFIDNAAGYIWNNSTFNQIYSQFPTDPFGVAYLDGYFIVPQSSSNQWFISNSEDGSTWNALNFAELTSKPEYLMGVCVLNRRIYIFGKTCTEIWYSVGGSDFPFNRDNTIIFDYGCLAQGSIVESHGMLFFLGTSEVGGISLIMTTGANIKISSSIPVKLAFESYQVVSDARAYIYEINGHLFYIINFPTQNITWCYDISTDNWFYITMLNNDRYFGQCHLYTNNTHYVGSYKENSFFKVSNNYVTNNGESIKKLRTSSSFRLSQGSRLNIEIFELKFRQGNNTISVLSQENKPLPLREPMIYLEVSTNGGKTYSNKVSAHMGNEGQYAYRTIWRRLGIGEQFVFRMTSYEEFGLILIGCVIGYTIATY